MKTKSTPCLRPRGKKFRPAFGNPRFWLALVLPLIGISKVHGVDPTLLGKYPSSGSSPGLFYGVALDGPRILTVTYGFYNGNGALRELAGHSPPVGVQATAELNGFRKVEIGQDLYVLWSYNSAGNWRSGIRIFDKTTLTEYDTNNRLVWIGTRAEGMHVDGTHLYVGSDDGLIVIDVSDPDVEPGVPTSGPQTYPPYTGITVGHDVHVADGLAYVADGTEGLKILDVSNPASPVPVSTWTPAGGGIIRGVHVAGNLAGWTIAYLVGTGFWTVDVGDPNAPVTLEKLDEGAYRVMTSGEFAYVAGDYGLRIYDVSDPGNPSIEVRRTPEIGPAVKL